MLPGDCPAFLPFISLAFDFTIGPTDTTLYVDLLLTVDNNVAYDFSYFNIGTCFALMEGNSVERAMPPHIFPAVSPTANLAFVAISVNSI